MPIPREAQIEEFVVEEFKVVPQEQMCESHLVRSVMGNPFYFQRDSGKDVWQ